MKLGRKVSRSLLVSLEEIKAGKYPQKVFKGDFRDTNRKGKRVF